MALARVHSSNHHHGLYNSHYEIAALPLPCPLAAAFSCFPPPAPSAQGQGDTSQGWDFWTTLSVYKKNPKQQNPQSNTPTLPKLYWLLKERGPWPIPGYRRRTNSLLLTPREPQQASKSLSLSKFTSTLTSSNIAPSSQAP